MTSAKQNIVQTLEALGSIPYLTSFVLVNKLQNLLFYFIGEL